MIVGNPPYIRIQNMVRYSAQEVAYYKSAHSPYETAKSDNFDKYTLFIERGLELLKPHRSLGYIVPHKFLTIKAGTALRRLLARHKCLKQIVHFGVQQVFQGRSTYTCLLILGDDGREHFDVEHIADVSAWRYGNSGAIQRQKTDNLDEAPWIFVSPLMYELFERWRGAYQTQALGDIADIFAGIQTSSDKIYVIRALRETAEGVHFQDAIRGDWTIEREILRPCFLDASFAPFSVPVPDSDIIFPYKIEGGRAIPYSPDEMQRDFPQCWAYLSASREELSQRSMKPTYPEAWYRYGRSQSLTRFNGSPKLVWQVLTTEPRYAYDNENIVFTGGGNGPYYALVPKTGNQMSLHYLQAILSHPLVELMVRVRSSVFRGGYVSHGKQFIANIPIRTLDFSISEDRMAHDEIVALVHRLIETNTRIVTASTPHSKTPLTREYTVLLRELQSKVGRLHEVAGSDLELLIEITTTENHENQ
ncbi:MAG: Eco57I restriction-modification methylase domain-containing protein [Armatimonadetes bacterium]|nr:Eco57I restriction-modification methylase domain-containing protein [Armatimonadota bacterium]